MTSKKPSPWGLENLPFSADDICRLLKTCARSGVQSIRWVPGAGLTVTFSGQVPPAGPSAPEPAAPALVPTPKADEITRRAIEEDGDAAQQATLDELLIQDPAEYERRVIDGSLVDEPGPKEETADDS